MLNDMPDVHTSSIVIEGAKLQGISARNWDIDDDEKHDWQSAIPRASSTALKGPCRPSHGSLYYCPAARDIHGQTPFCSNPRRARQHHCAPLTPVHRPCQPRRILSGSACFLALPTVVLMDLHPVLYLGAMCNVHEHVLLGKHWTHRLCGV